MEAAAIITLISIGHWLEARMGARASSALKSLLNLAPQTARLRQSDGSEIKAALSICATMRANGARSRRGGAARRARRQMRGAVQVQTARIGAPLRL